MKLFSSLIGLFMWVSVLWAQHPNPNYWQQHVDYTMDVEVDVTTFEFWGTQQVVYTNNSPDVLDKVFYHLYFNAFQPGS